MTLQLKHLVWRRFRCHWLKKLRDRKSFIMSFYSKIRYPQSNWHKKALLVRTIFLPSEIINPFSISFGSFDIILSLCMPFIHIYSIGKSKTQHTFFLKRKRILCHINFSLKRLAYKFHNIACNSKSFLIPWMCRRTYALCNQGISNTDCYDDFWNLHAQSLKSHTA